MSIAAENFLRNNKFNEKDIGIYLDIFRHGQSFASSISARTQIDRTTVYSSIKRLLTRGVIVQTKVNGVSAYIPVSPEIFVDRLDMKIEDLMGRKRAALSFAEELRGMQKSCFIKPKIRIFEGDEAIINLYEETLIRGGTQKSFLTIQRLPASMESYLKTGFMKSKKRKNVHSKVILADSSMARRYQKMDVASNRESRIVKKCPFNLHSEIILFGCSKVAIIDFHEQIYGMVIESETLYKTIEAMFDCIWELA